MAASVADIGTYLGTRQATTTDSSLTVTVPAGASLCVVCVTGYCGQNSNSNLLDQLAFRDGSLDFTHAVTGYYSATDHPQVSVYYLKSDHAQYPTAGSQTLHYRSKSNNAWGEGANICAFFLNGVNITGSPIVGTASSNGTSSAWTSSISGAAADDIGICCGYGYTVAPDADPATYGQTAIWEPAVSNNAGIAVGYEVGTGSGALRIGVPSSEIVGTAVVFLGTTGGGAATAVPVFMNQYRQRRA